MTADIQLMQQLLGQRWRPALATFSGAIGTVLLIEDGQAMVDFSGETNRNVSLSDNLNQWPLPLFSFFAPA